VIRSSVSIVRCKTYKTKEVELAVKRAVDLLGGMEKFVKAKSRVLIKPNLLSARTPEEGVDTHPEVIRAVARLVKPITPHIFVGDSPGGWELKEVDTVYEKSGTKKVCEEEGLQLVKFDKATDMEGFPIASIVKEVDSIISIPKLKTHSITTLTGAVKNMFGTVIGLAKAQCHLKAPMPDELSRLLVKIFALTKPTLSVMDGVVGMEGEGPGAGPLRDIGLVIASQDAVALDSVLAKIVGVNPSKVPTNLEASKRNEGISDLSRIDTFGEKPEDVRIKDFKLPKASFVYNLPKPLLRLGLKNIRFHPDINKDKCQRCELCFKICPNGAIKKLENGVFEINIKKCIYCFCCHEVCPHKAIALKKSLMARIIMR